MRDPRTLARTMADLAPNDPEQDANGQYTPQTLEDLRAQLLNLADTVSEFGALVPPGLVDMKGLDQAKTQFRQMSYAQLSIIRRGISPSKMADRLQSARTSLDAYIKTRAEGGSGGIRLQPKYSDPDALPVVSGFCHNVGSDVASGIGGSGGNSDSYGPSRIPASIVLAADVTKFVADSVRELAQDACKETVVALGEGGNTSLACTVVDIVWIVAEAVDFGIHFCDDDLTGNVIDTNYARLDDVHTDVNNVGSTLDTHLTNVDTHLTNVDNHIASEFTELTTLVTTLIGNLSAQVAAATDQLVAGEQQIMKLDMTPDGQRKLVPAILTCDGTTGNTCPAVLAACAATGCSWNRVGPLP